MAAHERNHLASHLVLELNNPSGLGRGCSRDDWLKRVQEAGLLPVGHLSPAVRAKLETIRREDQYERAPATTSAAAILTDGTYLIRVVFIPERYVRQWLLPFWTRHVKPESVADVQVSPNRIPMPHRTWIWGVGETSMGSLSFIVRLEDGTSFGCLYRGANDFIVLPPPYTPQDISRIQVGQGLARTQKVVLKEPDFVWCPYKE